MLEKQAVYRLRHLPSSFLCSLYPSTEPHNYSLSFIPSKQAAVSTWNQLWSLPLRDSNGSHSLVPVSFTCLISAVSNPPGENLLTLRLGTSPLRGVPSPRPLPSTLLPLGKPSLGAQGRPFSGAEAHRVCVEPSVDYSPRRTPVVS